MKNFQWLLMGGLLASGGTGCDDDSARAGTLPFADGRTHVIGPDGEVREVATPRGSACLALDQEFPDAECITPPHECEGAVDVLLDREGKLLETLCYPPAATLSVAEIAVQGGQVVQNQNNAVIVLGASPAPALEGDLSVDANKVVVYGAGPDASRLAGDLVIDGNKAVVRGVRIQGDVHIVLNGATLFYCAIEGDLVIEGNNALIAGCDVFGDVEVRGNNIALVGNRLAGKLATPGKNTRCAQNVAAEDRDGNLRLEGAEVGGPLACK